jgi:hypothetical protein
MLQVTSTAVLAWHAVRISFSQRHFNPMRHSVKQGEAHVVILLLLGLLFLLFLLLLGRSATTAGSSTTTAATSSHCTAAACTEQIVSFSNEPCFLQIWPYSGPHSRRSRDTPAQSVPQRRQLPSDIQAVSAEDAASIHCIGVGVRKKQDLCRPSPAPTLVIRSPMLLFSKSLAKRPGQ